MKVFSLKWAAAIVALQTIFGTAAYAAESNYNFTDTSKVSGDKMAAIQKAVEQGLLAGDPQGTFRPSASLTRQELAVLLIKAMKIEPVSGASTFKDVLSIQFSAPYIEAAQKAGLLTGDGAGNFRPNDPVTREELASVFVRAVGGVDAKGGAVTLPLDQSQISPWAEGLVNTALRLGLIDIQDRKLNPRSEVKREDIAPFLLDIFRAQEQTASIDSVDGDIVTIHQVPYLIDGQLKKMISSSNKDALQGAILKFNSRNRNVNGLQELQIVQKDTVLDTTALPESSLLRISSEGVRIQGDVKGTLELQVGVMNIQLNGNVNYLTVNAGKGISIAGNGTIHELTVTDPNAKVTLNPGFRVETLLLPKGASVSQVIQNYNEVRKQIGRVHSIDGTVQDPSTGTPYSGASSSSAGGTNPTVPATNHEPNVISSISDMTLSTSDQPKKIQLGTIFVDSDGDTLTYTASSSNRNIVQAATGNRNGEELTITPVSTGTATVTITANDGHGHTKEMTFSVIVQSAPEVNHAPTVKNGFHVINMELTEGAKTVSIVDAFQDEDGDALTYTAVSSAVDVATVSVNGSDLNLTPVKVGTTTITVTADDGKGGAESTSFTLVVTSSQPLNHDPVVQNKIKDVSTEVGAADTPIDLASTFSDEDHDTLSYTAVSSDPSIATVTVTGDQLSIAPLLSGTTTVTVTADDGHGATAQTTFQVTVGEKRGLFFSELAWGESDSMMQIIELYNASSETLDATKIKIVRSDDGEPIVISPEAGAYIPKGATFTIGETMYFGDIDVDYDTDMGFYNDDSSPVTLSLYYDDQLVDTAVFQPHTTLARKSQVVHGSAAQFIASEWIDEGADYTEGLNSFQETP
ncbi:S-layer homology domain-containing protein [Paenibacillus chibensis]|uniref:S-layer homology domain-containing protein n=1 Tax=Paenibacillus chibensis TaxID=59846 RepID=A0ABU6PQF5_9BACL|nr:S-layer homology domain-containing protein [Paenibacillus chibensis]